MDKEIWKDIPGFKGLYQVSSLGKVKSMARIPKVTIGHIWSCVNGKRKHCGGYRWRYYEKD